MRKRARLWEHLFACDIAGRRIISEWEGLRSCPVPTGVKAKEHPFRDALFVILALHGDRKDDMPVAAGITPYFLQ